MSVLFLMYFLSLGGSHQKLRPSFAVLRLVPGFAGPTFPMAIGIVASQQGVAFFNGVARDLGWRGNRSPEADLFK